MQKHLRAAALSFAMACSLAGGAVAQQQTPIQRIFPAISGFEVSARNDLMAEGRRTYEGVIAEGIASRIMIDQITFGVGENNQIEIAIRNLTLRPVDETRPILLLAGLRILMGDWPDQSQDRYCEWVTKVEKLQVEGIEVRFPANERAQPGTRIKNLSFERVRNSDECWISGIAAATSLEVTMGDDSSFSVRDLRAQARLPASAKAAAKAGAPVGAIRSTMEALEVRGAGRSPAFGFIDASAGLNVRSSTVSPLLSLLERTTLTGHKANGELNLMQILNAMTLVEADMTIDAPVTRIYSAGVVPPEAVTNFSRVGLSTITGKSRYDFSLASGELQANAEISLIGLIDASMTSSFTLLPYPLQKLEASAKGIAMGPHLIPDASLDRLELKYRDRGLDGYVNDLTGVPSGRFITEFAHVLAEGETDRIRKSFSLVAGEISEFFRYAASGFDMSVTADPPARVNMSRIALLALTDIQGLAKALGLNSSANRPEQAPAGQ